MFSAKKKRKKKRKEMREEGKRVGGPVTGYNLDITNGFSDRN